MDRIIEALLQFTPEEVLGVIKNDPRVIRSLPERDLAYLDDLLRSIPERDFNYVIDDYLRAYEALHSRSRSSWDRGYSRDYSTRSYERNVATRSIGSSARVGWEKDTAVLERKAYRARTEPTRHMDEPIEPTYTRRAVEEDIPVRREYNPEPSEKARPKKGHEIPPLYDEEKEEVEKRFDRETGEYYYAIISKEF